MINDVSVPWAQFEQIDIPTTGRKTSSPSRWRNSLDRPIRIGRVLIDSASVTTAQVRLGIRGQRSLVDAFIRTDSLHNTIVANRAVDGAWPLWKLRCNTIIPRRQVVNIELEDTVVGGERTANVMLHCIRPTKPSQPVVLADRIVIPDGGSNTAQLRTDDEMGIYAHALSISMEETGTAALLRGLNVRVSGGAMPSWMDRDVRASVLFPDINPAAAVYTPPQDIILQPGEAFEAEFFDTSGGAVTVYLGAVGATTERRS